MARPEHDADTAAPRHPCVLGALVEDVGRYLLGPDAPEASRRLAAQQAFQHARADFDAFATSMRAGTDVVLVELTIRGPGVRRHSVYTHAPGPLALLLVAARNCRPGDLVTLRQVTAKSGQVSQSARWPFGMAEAETMTRPVDALFNGFAAAGAHELRHWCRNLGRLGRVVFERERRDDAVRLPRLWGWRAQSGAPRRGVRVRWRSTTVRIGWSRSRAPSRHREQLAS